MAVFVRRLSTPSFYRQVGGGVTDLSTLGLSSKMTSGGVKQWCPMTSSVGGFKSANIGSRGFSTSVRRNAEFAEPSVASPPQGQPAPSRIEKTVNTITLMGRVGADPQKRGSAEHPVVVFSLATHANYNYQDGGMLQKTDWHRVCVFKPYLRDTVYKYMTKGQRVFITGRVSYGEIKDEQGNSHVTTSIIAEDVIFITDSASRNRARDSAV